MTRVGEPLACSMAWSFDGNDSDGGNPYPAVALAPSATICAEPQRIVAKKAIAAIRTIQTILLLMRFFHGSGIASVLRHGDYCQFAARKIIPDRYEPQLFAGWAPLMPQ